MLSEELELQVRSAAVLDIRESLVRVVQFIAWQDLPECENSWESATIIQDNFPVFTLSIESLKQEEEEWKRKLNTHDVISNSNCQVGHA